MTEALRSIMLPVIYIVKTPGVQITIKLLFPMVLQKKPMS
jgi:hypothetical protein